MNDAGRGRRRVRVQGAALAILLAASALETVAVTSGLAAARDALLVMIAATMVAAAVWG